jgi:hypothetical protein
VAAYTASVTGNWADTATWGGSGPPVNGDSAAINTGITVTVAAGTNAACGTSADNVTTYDVDVAGTGKLVIADGARLVVKGNLRFVGGSGNRLEINGTGVLEIDATPRTTLTSGGAKVYRILGGDSGEWTCYMRGTDRSNLAKIVGTTGGYWYHTRTAGGTLKGLIDIEYGRFERMWNGVTGISAESWVCNRATSGVACHIEYLEMDSCGFITMSAAGTGTADISRAIIENSVSNDYYGFRWNTFGASASATMTKCVMDVNPNSDSYANLTMTECVFTNSIGGLTAGANSKNNVLIRNQTSGTGPGLIQSGSGLPKDQLHWARNAAAANPHFGFFSGTTGTQTADGIVIVYAGNDGDGDVWNDGGGSATYTVRNCITLKGGNGQSPGVFLAPLVAAGTSTITIEHCGILINQYGVLHMGENVGLPGHTGMVATFANNHCYLGADTPVGYAIVQSTSGTVANRLTASGADYNWIEAGAAFDTPAECYDPDNQTVPTAANDTYNTASDCLDLDRGMAEWAGWWGTRIGASGNANGDATDANALNLLTYAYRDAMYAGSDMIEKLLQYLRRGWMPTATAMRATGSDSKTRSAFGMWAPALSALSASASGASCTTNAADGTLYWVLTTSATAPDWDRIIAGQDHTGASLPAAQKGSVAVSTTSPSWSYSPDPGTYYLHIVHSADATTNGDAGQEAYLRTSAETSSSSFTAGAASSHGASISRIRRLRHARWGRRAA